MKRLPLLLALLFLATGATRSAPFRPPRVVDLGEGHTPLALAAGDFDRDGKLDLVVGIRSKRVGRPIATCDSWISTATAAATSSRRISLPAA